MSGSVAGSIAETYFELRAYRARRIDSSAGPREESRRHDEQGAQVARGLASLADRIRAHVDELRLFEPWSRLLQKVETEAQATEARLRMFERLEYREILREVQERGAYAYSTSFPHPLGDTYATIDLRFVFKGWVSVVSLYDLEDALHGISAAMHRQAHPGAHAGGLVVRGTEGHGREAVLDAIRDELTRRLEERKLCCEGDELEGSHFAADLEGPDLFHARLELPIAGEHKWVRAKVAVLEAVRACAPEGVTEFPAPEIPWRLIAAPPGR